MGVLTGESKTDHFRVGCLGLGWGGQHDGSNARKGGERQRHRDTEREGAERIGEGEQKAKHLFQNVASG